MPQCYMQIDANYGVYHPKGRPLYLVDTGKTVKSKTLKIFASEGEVEGECAIRITRNSGARAIAFKLLTPVAILNRIQV